MMPHGIVSWMQVSKQDVEPALAKQLALSLHQLFTGIKTPAEAEQLLMDLLSDTERIAVMKRLGIAVFLRKGWSYEKIKASLKVSSATIATIQEQMGRPGWEAAIETTNVYLTADAWSQKLSKLFPFLKRK